MNRLVSILMLVLGTPLAARAQDSSRLTLADAWHLAEQQNPMLRAALARVDASAATERSASLLPDPALELGIMNASLPEFGTDMPGAMLPSIQLMQMIPTGGKLRLNGVLARQETAMLAADAQEAYWDVRARVAMNWFDVQAADRQLAVMRETLDWLTQFQDVATTMYSVGGGRQSDVLRAGVEVAKMRADIVRMEAMRTGAAARLNALLGRDAGTPLVPGDAAVQVVALPDAETLLGWAEESRPLLERGRLAVTSAATRETLARRELWPDLSVGLQYGQRPSDMGTERMGSVMVGFSLPIFASRRQLPMREEAAAMRSMATAELADARARVDARIRELVADLERATTLMTLYRSEVLPQAEANVTSAFASYRVGRVDFMTLLDAQMSVNTYAQELHALEAGYGAAFAELEMTVGRTIPAAEVTAAEAAAEITAVEVTAREGA